MKHKVISLALMAFSAITIISFAGCAKAGIGGPSYVIDGTGNGAQVVPTSSASAVGLISGSYDGNKNMLSATIKWSGLSGPPTAIHLHFGTPGRNGYPYFVLVNVPKSISDSINFQSAFTESLEGGIKINGYYFDIHTAAHPDGEIRGQLLAH